MKEKDLIHFNFVFKSAIIGFIFFMLVRPLVFEKHNIESKKNNTYFGTTLTCNKIILSDVLNIMQQEFEILFIDMRPEPAYKLGHIPKSLHFDLFVNHLEDFHQIKYLIFYGNRHYQTRYTDQIRESLQNINKGNVYIYTGGWEEWSSCGLPIEGENN